MSHWYGLGFHLVLSAVYCYASQFGWDPRGGCSQHHQHSNIKGGAAQTNRRPPATLVPSHAPTAWFTSRCSQVRVSPQKQDKVMHTPCGQFCTLYHTAGATAALHMHTRCVGAGMYCSRALPHLKCRSSYGIDRPFPATFAMSSGRLRFVLYAAARVLSGACAVGGVTGA